MRSVVSCKPATSGMRVTIQWRCALDKLALLCWVWALAAKQQRLHSERLRPNDKPNVICIAQALASREFPALFGTLIFRLTLSGSSGAVKEMR